MFPSVHADYTLWVNESHLSIFLMSHFCILFIDFMFKICLSFMRQSMNLTTQTGNKHVDRHFWILSRAQGVQSYPAESLLQHGNKIDSYITQSIHPRPVQNRPWSLAAYRYTSETWTGYPPVSNNNPTFQLILPEKKGRILSKNHVNAGSHHFYDIKKNCLL